MTFARHPLQLALGFIVWSVWFIAAYGGLSLGCSVAPPAPQAGAHTWINGLLAVLTLATAAGLSWCAWACWRARDAQTPPQSQAASRFMAPTTAALHVAAAIATLFVGLPLVVMPPCA
ncbi:hypothetical protein M8A51_09115 [Schlegelella sp. S2-27]|uniref:Uncharacterized protein n=1 Tax=Caldimonas mangrovi TaxID=2944811 RepID=A0ABT0YM09_9BURK|nr:hypothetical protein [Caldimonas mangrovi]MCM5679693.1 hypothetical protein [Caldimonas mangrovi]